jgi:hypothetical protein
MQTPATVAPSPAAELREKAHVTAAELREKARAICHGLPDDELHLHPAWRAAELIEELEKDNRDLRREVAAWRGA